MLIETKDIRKQIEDIWPRFKVHKDQIIFWDFKYYWAIPASQLEQLIVKSTVHEMKFKKEFNDCDNYALQFQAETRRKRYLSWVSGSLPNDEIYPVAIAMAHGNIWRGQNKNHKANLQVCDEGIYLADLTPTEKRCWKATTKSDNIFRINFT